ncbi:hypothetical protein GOP47_0026463 [Adiantum capillus-veneris]|nr:hypothetical protein GOP47_0026463 [Adiantum capillus-veneris]
MASADVAASSDGGEGAAPQVEWEWCSDSLCWNAYPPFISALIEAAFQSSRPSVNVTLPKFSYSIQFETLQPFQKNLVSGRTRPVKRQATDETSVSWLWWESEKQFWHVYGAELAQKIEAAWKESVLSKTIGGKSAPAGLFFVIRKQAYSMEFERDGLQVNLKTKFSRGVRRKLCLGNRQGSDEGAATSTSLGSSPAHGQRNSAPSSSTPLLGRVLANDALHNIFRPRTSSLACDQGPSYTSSDVVDLADPSETEDCSICLCGLQEEAAVSLSKCKHCYHRDCIESWFKNRPTCPECLTVYGTIIGTQPPGEMHVQYITYQEGKYGLAGYPDTDIIKITYNFRSGIQSAEHPSPGKPYMGTVRMAYLPKNREGEEVLELLRKAFSRRLLFRVGTSVTTGQNNVVTWAGIHHKTRMFGGSSHHGYPDDTYFSRVRKELEEAGVVSAT